MKDESISSTSSGRDTLPSPNGRSRVSLLLAFVLALTSCASSQVAVPVAAPTSAATKPTSTLVLTSEIEWQPLNPARGDASPMAATLWGDRNGSGPTGFLVRFVDGFASPPHIHNVSYRGVVIHGLIHNHDPNADEMWMPTGSFWTQPRGGAHITAASGRDNVAYIEIDEGPYLVRPVDEAFSSEERPVNVDASTVVWVDASSIGWSAQPGGSALAGARIALLWGDPNGDQPSGIFMKLPAGSTGIMRGHGSTFRAVVIRGRPEHRVASETGVATMVPGSYFSSDGGSVQVSCEEGEDCIIYVRTNGGFALLPVESSNPTQI